MTTDQTDSISKKARAQLDYESRVQRDYRHNLLTLVRIDFLWGCGLPFATYFTVVPAYLTVLGSPKVIIGIIAALFTILCPLQLLLSHWLGRRPRKRCLSILWIACVVPWLAYSLTSLYFPQAIPHAARLLLFCLCMIVFAGVLTSTNPLLFALLTDSVPLKRRGSVYGYRLCGLAGGVAVMSYPALLVMRHWPEPTNYYIGFALACAAYATASANFFFVREHSKPNIAARPIRHRKLKGLVPQLRLLFRKIFRDPNYRVFIFFMVLLRAPVALAPFIVVFAKEQLGLTGAQILPFTIIMFASPAVFTLVLGKLADKAGYKLSGVIMALLLTAGFVIIAGVAMASGEVGRLTAYIYIAFSLSAGVMLVANMVLINLSVELRPQQNAGMLIAAANTVMMPVILVASALAGLVIDLTGSYTVVFSVAAILALVGALGFAVLVREPREKRMYIIKYIGKP